MRNRMRLLLLLAAIAALMCVSASANDDIKSGFYNIETKGTGVYVAPQNEGGEVVPAPAPIDGNTAKLYNGSDRLLVTISAPAENTRYLVMLVKGTLTSAADLTASNISEATIRYIDQSDDGTAVVAFPAEYDKDMTLIVTASDGSAAKFIPVHYLAGYILGDANGDKSVDAADPLFTLQIIAGTAGEVSSAQMAAANANKDDVVDAADPLYILQMIAGTN